MTLPLKLTKYCREQGSALINARYLKRSPKLHTRQSLIKLNLATSRSLKLLKHRVNDNETTLLLSRDVKRLRSRTKRHFVRQRKSSNLKSSNKNGNSRNYEMSKLRELRNWKMKNRRKLAEATLAEMALPEGLSDSKTDFH